MSVIFKSCVTHKLNTTYFYTDQYSNQYGIRALEIDCRSFEPSEKSSAHNDRDEKTTTRIPKEIFKKISNQANSLLLTTEKRYSYSL
jgi:hypothetical protein